jgi:hypothetical protein
MTLANQQVRAHGIMAMQAFSDHAGGPCARRCVKDGSVVEPKTLHGVGNCRWRGWIGSVVFTAYMSDTSARLLGDCEC